MLRFCGKCSIETICEFFGEARSGYCMHSMHTVLVWRSGFDASSSLVIDIIRNAIQRKRSLVDSCSTAIRGSIHGHSIAKKVLWMKL